MKLGYKGSVSVLFKAVEHESVAAGNDGSVVDEWVTLATTAVGLKCDHPLFSNSRTQLYTEGDNGSTSKSI